MQRKCEQYWGENIGDDFETPDNKLRITTTSVLPLADFDIRIFTVKSVSLTWIDYVSYVFIVYFTAQIENPDADPLRVTQYHFTSWPDHGVPKFATSLTAFIRRVQKGHNKDDGYPLLVHCSAGVGRTGTFILLDSMLERMKAEDTVNVYEFLYNMRTRRVLMVQTQVSYIIQGWYLLLRHAPFIRVIIHAHTYRPSTSSSMMLLMNSSLVERQTSRLLAWGSRWTGWKRPSLEKASLALLSSSR